tara:strand:+ start:292 stop:1317 length:1026 start_codon:yes stop_codon:yes gene_type:complete
MIRVCINGLGRIGRNCFRLIQNSDDIEVVHLNDPNMSLKNLVYLLNYDSIYGRNESLITSDEENLIDKNRQVSFSQISDPMELQPKLKDIDVFIESSGVINVQNNAAKLARDKIVKKTVITHTYKSADKTIILGVDSSSSCENKDNVISTSICDSTAVAPVIQAVMNLKEIETGTITTLHPWLQYQNLMDGPCRSFAHPHQNVENFSLGRASTEAIIPKTTSCIEAVNEVHPNLRDRIFGMSFRVPTPSVSCAIIDLNTESNLTSAELFSEFEKINNNYDKKIFHLNNEELISRDFTGLPYSAIIDKRWIVIKEKKLRVIAWYDNEYGYCSRVLDIIKKIV